MKTHDLKLAIDSLNSGQVVAIPTETVYGLAGRIDNPIAIKSIFTVKERPFFDPLIVHVFSIDQARTLTTNWSNAAQALASALWPGPLTLVLPKAEWVDPMITSGLETVGLRMPDHPLTLELIRQTGVPLAAPSANKFGRTSPVTADHVESELGANNILVLDGGPCRVGLESTVVLLRDKGTNTSVSILRPGAVTPSQIKRVLDERGVSFSFTTHTDSRLAPGQMKHHYMPKIPLVTLADASVPISSIGELLSKQIANLPDTIDEVKIPKPTGDFKSPFVLTFPKEPELAARVLYSELRRGAESGADHLIYRKEGHQQGEAWSAFLDRIVKASSLVIGSI